MEEANRRLMFHGMCLFPAHLEGLMNGTFLVALGAIWTHVRLSPSATAAAYWTALYGTYANWLMTVLAATFGTAALSPITGAGHSGLPWQESFVTIGFMSVGIAIIVSSILVIWGLRKRVSA
jgi:hydroxylaminobenzene mutase